MELLVPVGYIWLLWVYCILNLSILAQPLRLLLPYKYDFNRFMIKKIYVVKCQCYNVLFRYCLQNMYDPEENYQNELND